MKALFLLLFIPALAFGQTKEKGDKVSAKSNCHSPKVNPVTVQNGNVVDALYKVICRTAGEASYFDIVIYTHSYRDALQPTDGDALFIVDGLGKVFDILHWTSRYEPDKIVSSIAIRLSKEELKSISYAGTVGVKIGDNTFFIPHMARHNMRQIIAHMESLSDDQTRFNNNRATGIKVFRRDKNKESLASNSWQLP